MRHFLLVYDLGKRKLVAPIEAFERSEDGVARRFDLEREHRDNPNVEIVLLGADSEAELRRTHRRYFETSSDILAAARQTVDR